MAVSTGAPLFQEHLYALDSLPGSSQSLEFGLSLSEASQEQSTILSEGFEE